jgi:DNA-binding NarL/FixJ family response regulator
MREYSILFIRADEEWAKKIESTLEEGFDGQIEWIRVDALFDGLQALQERSFDLIITDLFLPDSQGLPTLKHLKQQAPQTPVITLCHAKDRDLAVTAVRKGAHDFFLYEEIDPNNMRRCVKLALESTSEDAFGGENRRTNARFPCRLALTYQALEHPFFSGSATSETVNISSKGLLFGTNEPLQPGQLLQVSVDWPARLENEVALKLVAEGRVIRNVDGQAAVRIDKYEFRTRKVKAQPAGAASSGQTQTLNRPKEAAEAKSNPPGTAAGIRTNRGN